MVCPTLLFGLFAVTLVKCTDLDSRMHNGQEIGDDFKFLVRFEITLNHGRYWPLNKNSCSGSILSSNLIITAAHCVDNPNHIREIRVTDFGDRPATSVITVSGANVRIHPNFKSGSSDHIPASPIRCDIAIMMTTQPMPLNQFVQPIRLGRQASAGQVTVAGYGLPDTKARKGVFTIEFDRRYNTWISKTNGLMPRNDRGDSGGPVVANGVLVGVTSSVSQELNYHLNLFADVESNYDWIQSVIGRW